MKLSKAVKLFIAILLVCAFIIPEGVSVSAASYKTGIYKINTQESPLNVRTCPSSENMKVGSIPKGTKVNVTFVSSNGWGKVVYGDVHGWISLEYCKYVGAAEEPVTVTVVLSYLGHEFPQRFLPGLPAGSRNSRRPADFAHHPLPRRS